MSPRQSGRPEWDGALLSNHALTLVCIATDADHRLTHIAGRVGVTVRGLSLILDRLVDDGILERVKEGRRVHYVINGWFQENTRTNDRRPA